jgi:hypothetical protein
MPLIFTAVMSAINLGLGFLLRSVLIKFVVYFALYFVITEGIQYLTDAHIFPNGQSILSILQGFSAWIWWGLDLVAFDITFPMVLGAYTTRFIIKLIRGM